MVVDYASTTPQRLPRHNYNITNFTSRRRIDYIYTGCHFNLTPVLHQTTWHPTIHKRREFVLFTIFLFSVFHSVTLFQNYIINMTSISLFTTTKTTDSMLMIFFACSHSASSVFSSELSNDSVMRPRKTTPRPRSIIYIYKDTNASC